MHLQILVHPQGIHGSGIKTCKEHIDNNQNIQFFIFHPERYILIIILEFIAGSIVVRMEHFVVIFDGSFQKFSGRLIKRRGVFWIFFIQNAVRFFLICTITENRRNAQLLRWICCHLLLKFLIIQFCHRYAGYRKNRIKSADALLPLDFLHLIITLSWSHLFYIGQRIIDVCFIPPIGLLVKMLQYILCHDTDALRGHHNLLPVNIPYHLVCDFFIRVHRLNIIYPERKDILIIDCIHDRVTMQLIAKGLPCRKKLQILRSAGIYGKNRSSRKSEQVVFLEIFYNSCVHISKLAAMALVKNNDDVFCVHLMPRILLNKRGQLLNGRNNDMRIRIFQLTF